MLFFENEVTCVPIYFLCFIRKTFWTIIRQMPNCVLYTTLLSPQIFSCTGKWFENMSVLPRTKRNYLFQLIELLILHFRWKQSWILSCDFDSIFDLFIILIHLNLLFSYEFSHLIHITSFSLMSEKSFWCQKIYWQHWNWAWKNSH